MASKASMLKSGANKASSGLFAGMTPLSKETDKKSAPKTEEKKVEVAVKEKEPQEVKQPVVEEVKAVEKVVEEPIQEAVEEKPAPADNYVASEPVRVKEEVPVEQVVNNPVMPEPVMQPVQEVIPQPQVQQPHVQTIPQEQVVPQTNAQAYAQQIPVQQYQQVQQIPVYQQMPSAYQQPVMMPQSSAPVYNEIKQTTAKQSKQDKSRYEKDKFLLLDIRGYRDYVEHMAKASNMSATKYIRNLIEQDMTRNMDIYLAHKQLEERLRERR